MFKLAHMVKSNEPESQMEFSISQAKQVVNLTTDTMQLRRIKKPLVRTVIGCMSTGVKTYQIKTVGGVFNFGQIWHFRFAT